MRRFAMHYAVAAALAVLLVVALASLKGGAYPCIELGGQPAGTNYECRMPDGSVAVVSPWPSGAGGKARLTIGVLLIALFFVAVGRATTWAYRRLASIDMTGG